MGRRLRIFGMGLLGLLLALAAGCGGGTSGTGDNATQGKVLVSLTDAEGDFLSYVVNVTSIRLTRADGAVVETMPQTAAIDFAQLTELTELVTSTTVPNGNYKAATLTLDFTNADNDITVEVGGRPVKAAVVVLDSEGNPIPDPESVEVQVKLDNVNPQRGLTVAPGTPAHLVLDFDLAATNKVDLADPTNPVVTVEPILVADLNPVGGKPHQVRGPLVSADDVENSFVLDVRPFHRGHGSFGRITVTTDAGTVFEVNGETGTGNAGFDLLKAQTAGTAIMALGRFDGAQRFKATEVRAGSNVPGGASDVVTGVVTQRIGDVLTVRGAELNRKNGSLTRNADVEVTVGSSTKVTRQDSKDSFGIGDISVGQLISATGGSGGTAPDALTLDATAGSIRLLLTPISGSLIAKSAGSLVLEVDHMASRDVRLFDFTGTNSNPASYAVSSGSLTLAGFEAGDPIRLFGFVAPFGSSGGTTQDPDFFAETAVDLADVIAHLQVDWTPASSTGVTVEASALTLDLSAAGRVHHVMRRGIPISLRATPQPVIEPAQSGRLRFAIRQQRAVTFYLDYAPFAADLKARLAAGAKVGMVSAVGSFADAIQTLTAREITVMLR